MILFRSSEFDEIVGRRCFVGRVIRNGEVISQIRTFDRLQFFDWWERQLINSCIVYGKYRIHDTL